MLERRPSCLLPDSVEPVKYRVHLMPLPDFLFSGKVEMTLLVRKPTREIVMNADDLADFRNVILSSSEGIWTRGLAEAPRLDAENQTLTLNFGEPIPFGAVNLRMEFSGAVNDKLCGLYRSTYQDSDGAKKYLVATQCEPIDCRKIFPCFDEPRWKAIFELAVDITESMTAVSNMPVMSSEALPYGFKRIRFQPTPPMSSYLFALLIGELDESKWLTGKTKDGLPVRVIAVRGKEHFGEYALNRAIRTLEFFTDYYQYGYPLPKYDLAAIPDFAAGAMENWGLEIFREPALLVDPKNTPRVQLERVELIVDHESGHHWHGDLVTMFWWNDISLNEAFATWTELLVARNLDPEKGAEEKFTAEDFADALKDDGLKTTRPVHVWIDHPDEIGEAFDGITYAKGGSCLRMLEYFVSPEKFREAMRLYVPRHAYGVITQKDLWRAIGEVSGRDVVEIMDAWWNKPGYPMITAERTPNGYRISQLRFLYETDKALRYETLWRIPMRIRTGNRPQEVITRVLERRSEGLDIVGFSQDSWIVWNAGATGFYRVKYTNNDLARIAQAIRGGDIEDACERISLFSDVAALTNAGHYSLKTCLDFFRMLGKEKHLRVWQRSLEELGKITSLFAHESYAPQMDEYIRAIAEEKAMQLGWKERHGDDYQTNILRGLLLAALGTHGHKPTIEEARKRFSRALKDLGTLNPDLRSAVYRTIGSNGDKKDYENLLSLYRRVELQEEKNRVFLGIASFKQPELIKHTLDFLLSDEVRKQDAYLYLRSLGENPHAAKMTWQFVKDKWDIVLEMYGAGKILGRVITPAASHLSSLEDEADVRSFFETNPVPDAKRTIAQALESIRINAAFYARGRDELRQYFPDIKTEDVRTSRTAERKILRKKVK